VSTRSLPDRSITEEHPLSERTPLIAGNWKMHRDHLEGIQLLQRLAYHLTEEDADGQDIVVCPPFTALRSLQTLIQSDRIPVALGAQDCHPLPEGAHTGDVSVPMLSRLDVRYVIVGHSERRLHHAEDDALVARKAAATLKGGLRPIVCVGEGETVRESGRAEEVVLAQLRGSLVDVEPAAEELVIAYEPVWASGTGRTATPGDAQEMAASIRAMLVERYGAELASGIRILYGGSVKPANIRSIMTLDDVDGVLVGGASLSAEDFALIVGHRRAL
jgi:triosephosphate isomerase